MSLSGLVILPISLRSPTFSFFFPPCDGPLFCDTVRRRAWRTLFCPLFPWSLSRFPRHGGFLVGPFNGWTSFVSPSCRTFSAQRNLAAMFFFFVAHPEPCHPCEHAVPSLCVVSLSIDLSPFSFSSQCVSATRCGRSRIGFPFGRSPLGLSENCLDFFLCSFP